MTNVPLLVLPNVFPSPTLIVQEFPAPTLPSQVFCSLKGVAVVMLAMLRSVFPKSVKVTGPGGTELQVQKLGKGGRHLSLQEIVKLLVDNVAFGPVTTPIPLKAIGCGLPTALLMTPRVAVRGPTCMGVNVIVIAHVAPAASPEPHVSVSVNSAAFVPVIAMPLMSIGCVPTLVSVTSWAVLPVCKT